MKKITLDLDTLSVQSFETTAHRADGRGTVRAAGASEQDTECLGPSCGPPCEPTFPYSCWGTCIGETCDPGCGPMSVDTCLLTCPDC